MHLLSNKYLSATHYHFGQDFLQVLEAYICQRQVIFIVEQVCWQKNLSARLFAYTCIIIEGGENVKTWLAVQDLVAKLWQAEVDRQTLLVIIGGGALLDMVSFVATCYMRGLDYCLIPTTLLAQVDASIGGKTAINFGDYKNLFGTFGNPMAIIWDYAFLQTLPDKHFRGAMAEIIKHAAIQSPQMWQELQTLTIEKLRNSPNLLAQIIEENVRIKLHIVQQDFQEQGIRKILNFGHTLAHALEQVYKLEHSEAVAIGMLFACRCSVSLAHAPKDLPEQMRSILQNYNLPAELDFSWERVLPLLRMDKKRQGEKLNLVLLEDIGLPRIYPIPLAELAILSKL